MSGRGFTLPGLKRQLGEGESGVKTFGGKGPCTKVLSHSSFRGKEGIREHGGGVLVGKEGMLQRCTTFWGGRGKKGNV